MSPSEWCLVLFPALPAELSQENGERGSNGEKEVLGIFGKTGSKWRKEDTGHFLESGVHDGDRELSSGDWGSTGEWGSLFGSRSDMKLSGFKCGDQGSSARKRRYLCRGPRKNKEVFGVQEKQKIIIIPSGAQIVRLFLVFNHSSP